MSIETARRFFQKHGMEDQIIEFTVSSATVELAAQAAGVEEGRIAKTISLRDRADGCILVLTAGDVRIDNAKFKAAFGMKAKMLAADEVLAQVGHAVGGVCPFGIDERIPVYLDESLQRFETVFPACGSDNSAIELTCAQLYALLPRASWVDVCKPPEPKV